ncbi:unnamed protein product [Rhizophagus irregularis]|nr:unnamed protein product [Rhizophagus irregularis]
MDLREDQLEPYEVTLTEMENIEMEVALTIVSGRQLEQPGKKAIETLRQQEPKPPLVTKGKIRELRIVDEATVLKLYPGISLSKSVESEDVTRQIFTLSIMRDES